MPPGKLFSKVQWPAILAVLIGCTVPYLVFGEFSLLTTLGVVIALWTIMSAGLDPVLSLFGKGPRLTRSMVAMQIAHLGLGLTVLGITVTSSYSVITDEGMQPGETRDIGGYTFRFEGTRSVKGPNYEAIQGVFEISRDGELLNQMLPEKRIYRVQTNPMSEAAIEAGWSKDLFIALGESLGAGAWSVRIQNRPLIRFIWFGCLVMALGGIIAVSDPRYRRKQAA
jgi:cytochrome c-type biogenesis protein CcmF